MNNKLIYDYEIICDKSNNSEESINNSELHAEIIIYRSREPEKKYVKDTLSEDLLKR